MYKKPTGRRALRALASPLWLSLLLFAAGRPGIADTSFHVNLDTSQLSGSFYVEFALSDGSVIDPGTPDTNNWATITNVSLDGGTLGGLLPYVGDASGDLSSGVKLQDGDAGGVADFAQAFTPGSALSFTLTLAGGADAGSVPDSFRMFLLGADQNLLPTDDPEGYNSLLTIQLDRSSLEPGDALVYGTVDGKVPPPVVTVEGSSAAPESASIWLLLSGVVPLLGCRRWAAHRCASSAPAGREHDDA